MEERGMSDLKTAKRGRYAMSLRPPVYRSTASNVINGSDVTDETRAKVESLR